MGKREIGKLSISDLIVSILIGGLAALGIEKYKTDIFDFIIPIVLLMLFQVISAFFSLRSNKYRDALEGQPAIIIKNGKVDVEEMKHNRYNLDDLLMQLREQGIRSISEVEYAILENNGALSVFKYNLLKIPTPFPLPAITDGKIVEKSIGEAKKSKHWVEEHLKQENVDVKDVFYGYYSGMCGNKLKIIRRKEE